jgi:hypothetical protein
VGSGFHLEPLGPAHNERDHEAWMTSIEHIRSTPGFDTPEADWPVEMSLQMNLEDLTRHSIDFDDRTGFTYSIVDGDEVIGCVYIYPAEHPDHDAEVTSWVRVSREGMDRIVWRSMSGWIAASWPFSNPIYASRG